jgi:general secretion pathway protein D
MTMTMKRAITSLSRWPRRAPALLSGALLSSVFLLMGQTAPAQQQQTTTITPNYKDAELSVIVEAVSELTGKNFIIDPRVRANVTMLSSTPMSPDAFYEAFLAILQVHGFVAVPAGRVIKIIPDANARQVPANDLPDSVSSSSDEIVTQVIAVKNVSSAQLVPILRPLIPQYGHLAAYPASNMLIISDRANNVNRMIRIIRRIDQAGDEEPDIIPLQHASAAEVVRVVNSLFPPGAQAEGGTGVKLVADERTNSVIIGGEKSNRLRLKTLVMHLDTPLEAGGDTQVRYLRYADAEKLAAKLKEQLGATIAVTGGAPPPQGGAAAGGGGGGGGGASDRGIIIWAEPDTNALVVTAPPKIMRSLMAVVDKLDIRRAQVDVEAIIVDVSTTKAAELGVNWLVDGSGDSFAVGGFISPIGASGTTIIDIVRAVDDPTTLTSIPTGITVGAGRVRDGGTSFAAILKALRSDSDTNIIATPHIITMDNQEAQIKDAREVPFVTGQFTNTGAAAGAVNPFQTIQRQEVGTILKVTPQISDAKTIMLKIEQESSDIADDNAGAVDVVTIKRTISTSVLVEDGAILVLGGLIRDRYTGGEQRVPLLGKIPLLGNLFRVRSANKQKQNLMVFIKPKILRDGTQTAILTNEKYDYIGDELNKMFKGKVPMIPYEKPPSLPALPPENTNPDSTESQTPQDSPAGTRPGAAPTAPAPTPPTPTPTPQPQTTPPPEATVSPAPPGRPPVQVVVPPTTTITPAPPSQ